jgi:hypothetical protein
MVGCVSMTERELNGLVFMYNRQAGCVDFRTACQWFVYVYVVGCRAQLWMPLESLLVVQVSREAGSLCRVRHASCLQLLSSDSQHMLVALCGICAFVLV